MSTQYNIAVVITLCVFLGGCGGGGSTSSSVKLEPIFSSIQNNIFTPKCNFVGCHGSNGPAEGLSLVEGLAYNNLVGQLSTQVPEMARVQPNDPNGSYLILKLEGRAGNSGPDAIDTQMPFNRPPLSSAELAVIKEWILNGADDDNPASLNNDNIGPNTN